MLIVNDYLLEMNGGKKGFVVEEVIKRIKESGICFTNEKCGVKAKWKA